MKYSLVTINIFFCFRDTKRFYLVFQLITKQLFMALHTGKEIIWLHFGMVGINL